MPDPLTRAAYCLRQSEQCLRLADLTEDADRKAEYRQMAQEYLDLADAERQMAGRPERGNVPDRKVSLKVVSAPFIGHVLDAPPVLVASDNSVDYTCGQCGTILLHAADHQVYNLLIRCNKCGSYNVTET